MSLSPAPAPNKVDKAGTGGAGSFFVWDGRQIADYRAGRPTGDAW